MPDSSVPDPQRADFPPAAGRPVEPDAIAPTWHIRPANRTDLEALTDLLAVSFHSREGPGKWLNPLLKTALREDLRGRLQNPTPSYRCLVAVRTASAAPGTGPARPDNALLGTIEIGLKPQFYLPWYSWFKLFPYISNLAIAPAYRRRGIAVDLLGSCEAIAQQWGYQDLYLHVLENNQAARALYRKAGFRCRQTEVSFSSLLLGQPRQLLMHKGLPASRSTQAHSLCNP